MRREWTAISLRPWDKCTRVLEGGRLATQSPGRHSVAGRIGRGTKPPPQLGQTLYSLVSTQSAQKVHSNEQMRARVDRGGKSRSQYSQLGRSSKAMASSLIRIDPQSIGY
jgi:hypothetical protein